MPWNLLKPRSTGWWDITAAMHSISPIVSGQLIVEREGDTVWLDFRDLDAAPQGSSYASWVRLLPVGMRPLRAESSSYTYLTLPQVSSAEAMRVSVYGDVGIYGHTGLIRGLVSFRTTQAMITTVPGGVKL